MVEKLSTEKQLKSPKAPYYGHFSILAFGWLELSLDAIRKLASATPRSHP